jgi:hypothetical protein
LRRRPDHVINIHHAPHVSIGAHLGLYGDVQRGSRGLSADGGWAKRAGEVEEGVSLGHGEVSGIGAIAGFVRRRGAVVGVLLVGYLDDIVREIWAGAVR